jgi:hypothetical protein
MQVRCLLLAACWLAVAGVVAADMPTAERERLYFMCADTPTMP